MLDTTAFKQGLHLLTGQVYVFVWWSAVYQAVRVQDQIWVASLWQGLRVTIHLRGVLRRDGDAQGGGAHGERNVFPAFAMKALQIVGDMPEAGRQNKLNELKVRHTGSAVNRAMLVHSLVRGQDI